MNKNQLKAVLSVDHIKLQKQQSHMILPRCLRSIQTSIPSINQTMKTDRYLQRLHNWRKQSKTQKLQETYDQNCRIFISLSKQKSSYHFQIKKGQNKKLPPLKLTPLGQSIQCVGSQQLPMNLPKSERYCLPFGPNPAF